MERSDDLETREEDLAAAEAASIGGDTPDAALDPADRPLAEAGEGESEGFELAEDELIRNAAHDDGTGDPLADQIAPENESDLAGSEFAEPDDGSGDSVS